MTRQDLIVGKFYYYEYTYSGSNIGKAIFQWDMHGVVYIHTRKYDEDKPNRMALVGILREATSDEIDLYAICHLYKAYKELTPIYKIFN